MSGRIVAPTAEQVRGVPELWHQAPRRWGHPLHSLCSYFAMFPPQLARVLLSWLTEPGDLVYDPFSGRGTVALEASLLGRSSCSSDANPIAQVLTQAKTVIPTRRAVLIRLGKLERSYLDASLDISSEPDDIRMLFSDSTLRQLVFLKSELDASTPTDCFLVAAILGMLHANHEKNGATRGFSISMPNTFSMAPRYVERYIRANRLTPPEADVFSMLRRRIDRLELPTELRRTGSAVLQDATARPPRFVTSQHPKLILTSPPYLQVIKYGKYNWIRLWFLGKTGREVDSVLTATSSLSRYLSFMERVCDRLDSVLDDDGFVCLVIGDVRRPSKDDAAATVNLAEAVWTHVCQPMGWHLHANIADTLPEGHKVSRIWKNNTGRATKTDRLLLMSRNSRPLPALEPPVWITPSFTDSESAA